MKILLIEDAKGLADATAEFLRCKGHQVLCVSSVKDAKTCLTNTDFSVIILDLGLQDGSGLDILEVIQFNNLTETVAIVTTATESVSSRIKCLNCGADDYLIKPYDLNELVARINALIRRLSGRKKSIVTLKECVINLIEKSITKNNRVIKLSSKEWSLLEKLCQNPNRIYSKQELENAICGNNGIESNSIEVHVSLLRKKISFDIIETVRGVGYKIQKTGI